MLTQQKNRIKAKFYIKNNFLVVIVFLIFTSAFSACSSYENIQDGNKDQKQNIGIEQTVSISKNTQEDNKSKKQNIEIGETVSASKNTQEVEITIKSIELKQDIWSTSDKKYKGYLSDVEGETYLSAILNIKNIGSHSVKSDLLYNDGKPVVKFADKYNYDMSCVDADDSILTQFWSIDPLKSVNVLLYKSIPDEIVSSPFTLTFTIGDNTYEISQNTGLKENVNLETSKSEEVMRDTIKQKIDTAYEMRIMSDKAYSDLENKYGDFTNVPPSQAEAVEAELNKVKSMLEESKVLMEEIQTMAKNNELNITEAKYYLEKFGY